MGMYRPVAPSRSRAMPQLWQPRASRDFHDRRQVGGAVPNLRSQMGGDWNLMSLEWID
jgi:hypothetical protein